MFVISFPLTSVVMHDVYVRFNSMLVSFQSKNPARTETKQNRRRKNRKKRSRREKDNRTQRRRAENKRGWAEQRRWKAKPQRNKPAVRLFVRCVGGWRHDSHCRSKFSTIVSANEGSSRYTGSGKRRLRFKSSLSLSLSLCVPASTPLFPLYPLSRRLFPYVSRPFHRGTGNMDWKKETAMLPGAAYWTQKSPPSPLSRDFYCNRRADVDSRSSFPSSCRGFDDYWEFPLSV